MEAGANFEARLRERRAGEEGVVLVQSKASPSGAVRVGEWKRVKAPSKRTMDNLRGNFDIEGNPL